MDGGLRAELLRRSEQDQHARWAVIRGETAEIDNLSATDEDNTAWLDAVIGRLRRWPGASVVGKDGAVAAWLLAQHADRNPDFQRRCLPLLQQAVNDGDAEPRHLAYLTDRVALTDGSYVPQSLIDPDGVDERRASVGLRPLAEYLVQMESRYGPASERENRFRFPCRTCKTTLESRRPETEPVSVMCPKCGNTSTLLPPTP